MKDNAEQVREPARPEEQARAFKSRPRPKKGSNPAKIEDYGTEEPADAGARESDPEANR